MTTLTITKARANLSALLEKAKQGEDIGIVSGDQIVALRPVTVSSDDYAWREYGATPAELARFEKRMEQQLQRSGSAGKSNAFRQSGKGSADETAGLSGPFRARVRDYPKETRGKIGLALQHLERDFGQPHRHQGLGIRKLTGNFLKSGWG